MDWILAFIIGAAGGMGIALMLLAPKYRAALQDAERRADAAQMSLDLAEMVGKVGTWSIDLGTSKLEWSDEVFRLYERPIHMGPPTIAEAIAQYHPDDRAAVQDNVDNAIQNGEDYEFELRLVMPGGETRSVISRGTCRFDNEGNVDGLYGAIVELHR